MCDHINTKQIELKREFGSHTFSTQKGRVCLDCGAESWTAEAHAEYMAWLGNLYDTEKDKFSVQVLLPADAIAGIDVIAARFPGVHQSAIVRALFTTYTDFVARNPFLYQWVEELVAGEKFASLSAGDRSRVHVRFKPAAYEDLRGLSMAFDVPAAKIVENAVIRMLAVLDRRIEKTDDPRIQKIQDAQETVERILKAA